MNSLKHTPVMIVSQGKLLGSIYLLVQDDLSQSQHIIWNLEAFKRFI